MTHATIPSSTIPPSQPALRRITRSYDVVVCGGGMAGIGAAITAARHGAKVALIQDCPVLGGNGSKEVRVWLQGASGGANALWFRETGLMEELLLENQFRNQSGQYELWDAVLLDAVISQAGLDLHLNTALYAVTMGSGKELGRIASVDALTLHSETMTTFSAPMFIDCTGDGTLGYLAGAPYMTGREAKGEHGESLAPAQRQENTLGGSILFLAKDIGKPVDFHPPSFAHRFTEKDFRMGRNPVWEFDKIRGGFWWIEWGGQLDTIHDNEAIKLELLRIAYGIFDYLKNDPAQREKNRNLTLEWVGTIPGKRESRRFIGDHVLTEQDVVARADFPDAIAFGGWNLDDHAPLGFFDDAHPPSTHTHIPGTYNIPLRSLYSKTIPNLLFAGRDVSATHIALTSVRVMLTCAQMGEAVGAAAAMCAREGLTPREIANGPRVVALRERLLRDDHHVIGARSDDPADLARRPGARATASSQLEDLSLDQPDRVFALDKDRLLMFPAFAGPLTHIDVLLTATEDTTLAWRLHRGDGRGLTIPAGLRGEGSAKLARGEAVWTRIPLDAVIHDTDWGMIELIRNPHISWHGCGARRVGIKSYEESNDQWGKNSNRHSRFGCMRGERNYCFRLPAEPQAYGPANAIDGYARPFLSPSLWISRASDFARPEWLLVELAQPAPINEVSLLFDADLDRHLVNAWIAAPHAVEPDLVKDYDLEVRSEGRWSTVAEVRANHLRLRSHVLAQAITGDAVRLVVRATNGTPRAQVYALRVYGSSGSNSGSVV